MKNKAAIYARFSTYYQRDTSLDDQIRRCRDIAASKGLEVDETLIFSDAALSGTSKHRDLRIGYTNMKAAWDAGKFDALIVDDFSRLTRDGVEQALLIKKLEDNQRVRLITANGIDTSIQNWQLQVGIIGAVGQQSIRDTKHLVIRGMLGQLERGYMIATPAIGYKLNRVFDSNGNRIGTHWKIDEEAMKLVILIFQLRGDGKSMHEIARKINEMGIPTTRTSRSLDGGFWRPARIKGILRNSIYRGIFKWNDSTTVRTKANKSGRELVVKEFERPDLRVITDELWNKCNENIISRSGYGGGKNALSGLVHCGYCQSILVLSSKSERRSMYCANCTCAASMLNDSERLTSTIAVKGVEVLLKTALHEFLTPLFVQTFRDKLQSELTSNGRNELESLQKELTRSKNMQEKLSRIMSSSEDDDPVLNQRYIEARQNTQTLSVRLQKMETTLTPLDPKLIKEQISIDPQILLDKIFDSGFDPEKLRSKLASLFTKIVFNGKIRKYTSHFTIDFCMGNALAMASNTKCMINDIATLRYELRFYPIFKGKGKDGPKWMATIRP